MVVDDAAGAVESARPASPSGDGADPSLVAAWAADAEPGVVMSPLPPPPSGPGPGPGPPPGAGVVALVPGVRGVPETEAETPDGCDRAVSAGDPVDMWGWVVVDKEEMW